MANEIYELKSYVNEKLIELITSKLDKNDQNEDLFPSVYIKTSSLLERVNEQDAVSFEDFEYINNEYSNEQTGQA